MNWSEATTSTVKAQEDHEFYFQDIILLVENSLFKVAARNFITESDVFATMFQLPQNPDVVADGLSNDQPLRLEGVKSDDFRQLLRVMYPSGIGKHETLTTEQWISVLALSTQWDMAAIRAEAIKNVRAGLADLAPEALIPHKLLNLGQTYRVDDWVMTAIIFFIKRKEPMGPNDAEIIGIENAFKIASLRECCVQDFQSFRVVEERPKLIGAMADKKRIEQLFGLEISPEAPKKALGKRKITLI